MADTVWRCPVCASALTLQGRSYRCLQNHCFDMAKEGYINLLLANQKKTAQPGDSLEQLQGRRRFLESGHYRPLLEKIYQLLDLGRGSVLADIGCGEGYYSRGLKALAAESKQVLLSYGIDIAKEGVRLAAKVDKPRNTEYAVASSFNLPWLDNSFDRVLRVFAPSKEEEVARVLKSDGRFLVVSPGPQHLLELRELLYREVVPHEAPKPPLGFELMQAQRLHYTLQLEGQQSMDDLLLMTPFNWRGEQPVKQDLEQLKIFSCQADFVLHVYKKL